MTGVVVLGSSESTPERLVNIPGRSGQSLQQRMTWFELSIVRREVENFQASPIIFLFFQRGARKLFLKKESKTVGFTYLIILFRRGTTF